MTYQTTNPNTDVTITRNERAGRLVLLGPGMLSATNDSMAGLYGLITDAKRHYPGADIYIQPELWQRLQDDDNCYACVTGRYACDIHTPEQAARMRPLRRAAWLEVA